jgi:hypothetical protein
MKLLFEPRDLWVGVYWDRKPFFTQADVITIYVVLIPTIVLRFQRFVRPRRVREQHRHQPIITDLKHAAEILEITKVRPEVSARLRQHAQTLWEEKP